MIGIFFLGRFLMEKNAYNEAVEAYKKAVELQKNVEYLVVIRMGGKFANETFIITSDNKVIMPHPRFERQNGRVYSVSVDKDGNKTLIFEPVSK